jgi:hypothetical protein
VISVEENAYRSDIILDALLFDGADIPIRDYYIVLLIVVAQLAKGNYWLAHKHLSAFFGVIVNKPVYELLSIA